MGGVRLSRKWFSGLELWIRNQLKSRYSYHLKVWIQVIAEDRRNALIFVILIALLSHMPAEEGVCVWLNWRRRWQRCHKLYWYLIKSLWVLAVAGIFYVCLCCLSFFSVCFYFLLCSASLVRILHCSWHHYVLFRI